MIDRNIDRDPSSRRSHCDRSRRISGSWGAITKSANGFLAPAWKAGSCDGASMEITNGDWGVVLSCNINKGAVNWGVQLSCSFLFKNRNGVVIVGCWNNVNITVTIHVSQEHITGIIWGRNIDGCPRWIGCSIVLVPRDGIVALRSWNNVKIAVTVHVGEINRFSIGSIRDNIGRRPGWVGCSVVLVPCDGIISIRCWNDVEITVTVHICDLHITCSICSCGNIGRGPRWVGCSVVLVPSDGVV